MGFDVRCGRHRSRSWKRPASIRAHGFGVPSVPARQRHAPLAALARSGYRPSVPWDVDGLDWDATDATEVEDRVVDGVLTRGDGAIVLLHSWPAPTLGALPGIARRLRDVGAVFVRLDELNDSTGHSPQS